MTYLSIRDSVAAKLPGVARASIRALAHMAMPLPPAEISVRVLGGFRATGIETARKHVRHVFVLMLENRSFDHVFGFSPITGLDPQSGEYREIDNVRKAPPANTVSFGAEPARTIAVDAAARYQLGGDDEDPAHEFVDVMRQVCGPINESQMWNGKLAGGLYPEPTLEGFLHAFVEGYARHELTNAANMAGAAIPMQCFAPEKLPVLNLLASAFALCDRWHASMPGPTLPNRLFVHAASSGGFDDSPSSGASVAGSIGLSEGVEMPNGTLYDRLDKADHDWSLYTDDSPLMTTTSFLDGIWPFNFSSFEDFAEDIGDEDFDDRYIFIEPNYDLLSGSPGAYGGDGNSMHPVGDMRLGEALIASTYQALRNSKIWDKSALIVTFDEHGGFYDHVMPPVAVPPQDDNEDTADNNSHDFRFDRLGLRVPALVISPYIPSGLVDGTLFDHSSIPAALGRQLDFAPLTARDAAANDFWHLFTLETPRNDAPTVFAGHPEEEPAQQTRAARFPRGIDPEAIGRPADGLLAMTAGALLKSLKRSVPEAEYLIWKHRLNHSLGNEDLKVAVRAAKRRLEDMPVGQPRKRRRGRPHG